MRIVAACLLDGVSITLTEDADGWRFVSWVRSGLIHDQPMPDPPADACARHFDDYETAKAYFREICPPPE